MDTVERKILTMHSRIDYYQTARSSLCSIAMTLHFRYESAHEQFREQYDSQNECGFGIFHILKLWNTSNSRNEQMCSSYKLLTTDIGESCRMIIV